MFCWNKGGQYRICLIRSRGGGGGGGWGLCAEIDRNICCQQIIVL